MFASLTNTAKDVLIREFGVTDIDPVWGRPEDPNHGDLSLNVALSIGKRLGKKPMDIAKVIVDALSKSGDVLKAEVAGAGYVNLWLTPKALLAALNETREACTAKVKRKDEAPIIIEYSQPNIAKPLGIHHILTTIIGQVLSNLNRHLGYNVIAINHIGDWGTQFGQIAVAFKKWGTKSVEECTIDDLLSLYVKFNAEAEKDEALADEGRAAFKKLEDGDKELRAFWKTVVGITMGELEKTYKQIGVSFDHTIGESFYEDKMMSIIEAGKKKGVFKEGKEGALIAEFPESSNLPPAIVLKKDGATLYHTRDLATIRYRVDTWHPEALYYVVDVAQQLYFQQLFAMVKQLEWDLPHLEHIYFGRMRFSDRSMSTRKGNVLKLQDVLDEAVKRAEAVIASHGDSIHSDDRAGLAIMMGRGSVVYGILSQNRKMDIVFDWDKMLSFDGNSAPYLQYTHARAMSVLEKAGAGEVKPGTPESLAEKERVLLGILLKFGTVLEEARADHMPHKLANYLYALCQGFNAFYNDEPILKAPEPARSFRLHLTSCTAAVLKAGAGILTIHVPDRM